MLLAAKGRPEEAAPFLRWLQERGRVSEAGALAARASVAVAAVYLALGQAETAFGQVAAVAEHSATYWDGDGPALVRTALAAGGADLAARMANAMTAQTPWKERVLVTCRALTAEARGESKTALAGFADASARWHDFGEPYEEAQALLGKGRCLMALRYGGRGGSAAGRGSGNPRSPWSQARAGGGGRAHRAGRVCVARAAGPAPL